MKIKITEPRTGTLRVYAGGKKKFDIKNIVASPGYAGKSTGTVLCGNTVQTFFPGCVQTTAVNRIGDAYFKIDDTWTFTSGGKKNISSFISFPAEEPELFIPSVLFNFYR